MIRPEDPVARFEALLELQGSELAGLGQGNENLRSIPDGAIITSSGPNVWNGRTRCVRYSSANVALIRLRV